MLDAHLKNVEKSNSSGRFDPYAGLSTSGIAGTGPDKEKEDEEKNSGPDAENKDVPSTEGKINLILKIHV